MPDQSLLATSDLHVTHGGNREVIESIHPYSPEDWLIVAGDVGDTIADVHWVLGLLRERFAKVIWAPGNHELWTSPRDPVQARGVERYERLIELARSLDVVTPEDPYPVWQGEQERFAIVPLFLLYDYSFRPRGLSLDQAMALAHQARVVATDEYLLHCDPYPTRQEWCHARIRTTLDRLEQLPTGMRTVLVSHWPLHRGPTTMLRYPLFAMWCGTQLTGDWHLRFRAAVAVYGHLHIPLTLTFDGVRFEEVSLGYPREWRKRSPEPPYPVRRILPADPERHTMNRLLMRAAGAQRRVRA